MPPTLGLAMLALLGYALEVVVLGLAIFPGAILGYTVWVQTAGAPEWLRILSLCAAAAAGFFLYGFTLILMTGLLHRLLRLKLREGDHPLRSVEAFKWAITVALKAPVSITFLNFILLTPFAALFYRSMGARIGRNVHFNTKSCADPSLLAIGDDSVIGGHATIVGHAFERGRLILRRVTIGKRVVVGLNAVILPGATVGDGASIAAGAVVPKGTRIARGSTYLGAPSDQRAAPPEVVESWR